MGYAGPFDNANGLPLAKENQQQRRQQHVYLPLREQDAHCPAIPSLLRRCAEGDVESLQMGNLIFAQRHCRPTPSVVDDEAMAHPDHGRLDLKINNFGDAKCLEALFDQLAPLSHLWASVTLNCWPWARNAHSLMAASSSSCGRVNISSNNNTVPSLSSSTYNNNNTTLTGLNLWECVALNDDQFKVLREQGFSQCSSLTRLRLRLRLTQALPSDTMICPQSQLQHVSLGLYGTSASPTLPLLTCLLREQDQLQSLSISVSLPSVLNGHHNSATMTAVAFQKALAHHASLRTLTLQGPWQCTRALHLVLQAVATTTTSALRRLDLSQTTVVVGGDAAVDLGDMLRRHVPQFSNLLQELWLPIESMSWKDLEKLGCALKQQQENLFTRTSATIDHLTITNTTPSQLRSVAAQMPWYCLPPLITQTLIHNVQCTVVATKSDDNVAGKLWPHVWANHYYNSSPTALFAFLRTANLADVAMVPPTRVQQATP